jgi:hypothetical protein
MRGFTHHALQAALPRILSATLSVPGLLQQLTALLQEVLYYCHGCDYPVPPGASRPGWLPWLPPLLPHPWLLLPGDPRLEVGQLSLLSGLLGS